MAKPKIKIPRGKKITWGVAGCGYYTEHSFLPTFQLLKKSKLTAVYSHSKERAKEIASKFGANKAYSDFDDFLKENFKAVYIGSANYNHYEQVIKAAKAGKHILCEKPLALTSKEAEEMVKVCKENNVYLSINYVHRFHPLVVKAKELIDNQMIGKIVSISASHNADIPPSDNFRFNKKLSGGGALWDIGTHMIDLLRYFGGEIDEIKGYIDNIIYKSEVEDFSSAVVKFNKSGYGYFNVSFNTKRFFNRVEILGYKGAISIENVIGKKPSSSKLTIDLHGETKKAFRRRANKLLFRLRDFQFALLHNEEPQVVGEDGLVNIKLMEELERQCR